MSVYYDLYASGNPQKKDEQQPLHARVIPSGTLDAKKFIELVSKSNGFSQATIEGTWSHYRWNAWNHLTEAMAIPMKTNALASLCNIWMNKVASLVSISRV